MSDPVSDLSPVSHPNPLLNSSRGIKSFHAKGGMWPTLRRALLGVALGLMAACGETSSQTTTPDQAPATANAPSSEVANNAPGQALENILSAQDETTQGRYDQRHPKETLEFFAIEPGMTVVEALPGGGWYSKILLPYLGEDGKLIGANYALDLWPNFSFADDAYLARMATWTNDWPNTAAEWVDADAAAIDAFVFGDLPSELHGTADAVLMVRALHNMARFADKRDYLGEALGNVYDVLKPGGVLGIVQHQAREDKPDEWANGSRGYLKKAFVIEQMEKAGFEFVATSDVNENPADQPGEDDIVWRLPPSLATSGENPELRTQLSAIGESNRMTLKFKKPE